VVGTIYTQECIIYGSETKKRKIKLFLRKNRTAFNIETKKLKIIDHSCHSIQHYHTIIFIFGVGASPPVGQNILKSHFATNNSSPSSPITVLKLKTQTQKLFIELGLINLLSNVKKLRENKGQSNELIQVGGDARRAANAQKPRVAGRVFDHVESEPVKSESANSKSASIGRKNRILSWKGIHR